MNLKHTPCDCAEWQRLNEACADLLAENDRLKDLVGFLKNEVENRDTYVISNLQAERDRYKADAERYRWLRDNWKTAVEYQLPMQSAIAIRDDAIDAAMKETTNA